MLSRFLNDRSGNFGIMSALLVVPLLGIAGVAIDVAEALSRKTQLQDAADSAALAAIAEKSAAFKQAMLMSNNGDVPLGIKDAEDFFSTQVAAMTGVTLQNSSAAVKREDNQLRAVFNYTASVPTTLLRVIGKDGITVSGQASAVFQTETFRDFFLLLDNTPSMGVAATTADINKMVANTPDKCAFACHIVKDGVEALNSYYNKAKSLGVTISVR